VDHIPSYSLTMLREGGGTIRQGAQRTVRWAVALCQMPLREGGVRLRRIEGM